MNPRLAQAIAQIIADGIRIGMGAYVARSRIGILENHASQLGKLAPIPTISSPTGLKFESMIKQLDELKQAAKDERVKSEIEKAIWHLSNAYMSCPRCSREIKEALNLDPQVFPAHR